MRLLGEGCCWCAAAGAGGSCPRPPTAGFGGAAAAADFFFFFFGGFGIFRWTYSTCSLILSLRLLVWSQYSHLNGFSTEWTWKRKRD